MHSTGYLYCCFLDIPFMYPELKSGERTSQQVVKRGRMPAYDFMRWMRMRCGIGLRAWISGGRAVLWPQGFARAIVLISWEGSGRTVL